MRSWSLVVLFVLCAGAVRAHDKPYWKRSFSALCLSSLAERELRAPFLGEQRFRKLLDVLR